MLSTLNNPSQNPTHPAIVSDGSSFSYETLHDEARNFAGLLLQKSKDLDETRVAFMVAPGFDYVRTQWAIWLAGGVAVPLCTTHPMASLQYVIEDTQASIIIVSAEFESVLKNLASLKSLRFIVLEDFEKRENVSLPIIDSTRRAMILYTSGTTNLPKGVVTTHKNIAAQVDSLVQAWEYSPLDHVLCILPLHHVHGIINVISCTLSVGATVEFLHSFTAAGVFGWFKKIHQSGHTGVFMAVPTIYFKLIAYFENVNESEQAILQTAMKSFRLMVSGSAALPVTVMEKWEKISGHRLLERYGMTEIGMAISNPFIGERRAGHIGQPLPGVEVRLADEQKKELSNEAGEIQIKGDTVFLEYWNKPQATHETFTADGWFKTGDIAELNDGYYKILGRNSVDIIKSGGYKISALEIEEILRTNTEIEDCSVVGIENEEWGEIVAAVLVLKNKKIDLKELDIWLRTKMPAYRVPRAYKLLVELPRNAMGKVTKNDLKPLFK